MFTECSLVGQPQNDSTGKKLGTTSMPKNWLQRDKFYWRLLKMWLGIRFIETAISWWMISFNSWFTTTTINGPHLPYNTRCVSKEICRMMQNNWDILYYIIFISSSSFPSPPYGGFVSYFPYYLLNRVVKREGYEFKAI